MIRLMAFGEICRLMFTFSAEVTKLSEDLSQLPHGQTRGGEDSMAAAGLVIDVLSSSVSVVGSGELFGEHFHPNP
jgi:hypothetical protein